MCRTLRATKVQLTTMKTFPSFLLQDYLISIMTSFIFTKLFIFFFFLHFFLFLFLWQDTLSEVSDYDCPCEVSDSVEDLRDLSPSLKGSEYFKDLEEGIPSLQFTTVQESLTLGSQVPADLRPVWTPLATLSSPVGPLAGCTQPSEEIQEALSQLCPKLPDYDPVESLGPPLDLTINLNGLLRMMETPNGVSGPKEVKEEHSMDLEGELEMDSFPILVRSMSTSRRHSWGVPVSPINLGRR